ncbi:MULTISPECIES: DUF1819 family protein [Microbacterium]|uniref:Inner membrane protein n=1 Tax=Microbacterium saccharophilum TaxID=1213358 RepID=A0A7Z7GDN8_9MICO|nr:MULTISPECIES: DUF1819 family protein [Microbacterium]SFI31208.1 Putative inner membrane protein [Microbacterium saccharophilum]
MNSDSAAAPRYALSFTTGGLLEREAAILAPIYLLERDWVKVRDLALDENLLQARTYRTGVRLVRETVKRLSSLSDHEIEILDEVTASERGHLMWAAACRRYHLIGEFAEEVLRERFLTLANTVSYEDYDSFYRAKAMWHDELDDVTDLSYKKLREVLFKMMVEAGLLTTQRAIEPALLSARVAECLTQRSPSDIRFFPTRQA